MNREMELVRRLGESDSDDRINHEASHLGQGSMTGKLVLSFWDIAPDNPRRGLHTAANVAEEARNSIHEMTQGIHAFRLLAMAELRTVEKASAVLVYDRNEDDVEHQQHSDKEDDLNSAALGRLLDERFPSTGAL